MGTVQTSSKIKDMVARLENPDGSIRQEARFLLVEVGSPAVPALVEVLQQSTYWGRWEAAKALGEIRSPLSAPALVTALEDKSSSIRWLAAEGLIGLGRLALRPLLEALTRRAGSICLREGAHHVLHDMKEYGLLNKPELEVYHALRGQTPDISVPWIAEAALKELAKSNEAKRRR